MMVSGTHPAFSALAPAVGAKAEKGEVTDIYTRKAVKIRDHHFQGAEMWIKSFGQIEPSWFQYECELPVDGEQSSPLDYEKLAALRLILKA